MNDIGWMHQLESGRAAGARQVRERADIEIILDGAGTAARCRACHAAGKSHEIQQIPAGLTTQGSCWGWGLPSFHRRCTGCGRRDGPWINADLVGGGY